MHNKVLVEVNNLSLSFPLRFINQTSIRDVVINTLMGPFSKNYQRNDLQVLKNISFQVFEGDRIGIIGINGAGKSSLCRCISGQYSPSTGNIIRHGKIRALFESSLGLYPELSGRENAKILAQIYFPDYKNELEEIVSESLDFSELGEFIDAPIKTYSNGMLVRLTLSLLSSRPAEILILDEVFDGADEFFREKLATRVKSLIEKSGSVIFVSHYEAQIEAICNRAILISNGAIAFDGSIKETYNLYRN
jgi:ABC-type polysaccharide/polyol phosphate transport system ATPase subunit